MISNLYLQIDKSRDKFSKGQKKIAKYIEDNLSEASYMTALKIAERVGVSESTVVRFATIIGYDGFPEMQKAMQEVVRDNLSSIGRIEVTTGRIGNNDVISSVLNQDIEKIRRTIEDVSKEDFDRAVDSITKAKKIYVFGVKSSSYIASFFAYYLDLIFGNVCVLNTTSKTSNYEKLFRITKDDVLIAVSFPRYSTMAVESMKFAKEAGADVIAITDSMTSPLAENADSLLIAHTDMASIVDTLVAPLSLINALLVDIVIKNKDNVTSTLSKLEEIWSEQYICYKKDEAENNE